MLSYKQISTALVLTVLLSTVQSASAGENGSFSMFSSWKRDYTTLERPGRSITVGTLNGTTTFFESSGAPFAAGTQGLSSCLVYAKRSDSEYSLEAHCTVTDVSNDKLYIGADRSGGNTDTGGGGTGQWKLLGGTGKFAGVKGSCEYRVEYLEDNWTTNTAEHCEWHKP